MTNPTYIKSKLNGNVIDIQGGSTKPATSLDAYPQKAPNDNQLWRLVPDPAGSGFYFIESKLNGNVVDIEGASTKAGALLDAYPQKTSNYDNQLWKVVADGSSGYSFIQSKLNGNVIDIVDASTKDGALLGAWPQKSSGNDNQLWQLIPETPLYPLVPIMLGTIQIFSYFWIQSKLNGDVVDILGGSTKPGASLDAWPKQDNDNQLWTFTLDPKGSGYFFISSKLNGDVIDILQGSTKPGAGLDAYPQTGNDNQLWKFVPDGAGWGFLESKLNGNVIDILQASTKPGAGLDAYPRTGNDNQLWMAVGSAFPELPSSLTWSNIGTGSGTTGSDATECAYTMNLTIQQDGTCRFWGSYTNRGDVPVITAPDQTFALSIVVLDTNGNGYSFSVGSTVHSAPQSGSTYSWDQTQRSVAIANNWVAIATRNYADYDRSTQASILDVINQIEQLVQQIAQAVGVVVSAVTTVVALAG